MRKALAIIFSLLLIGVVGFGISWSVINFNKVKEGMSGTQIYTNDDLQNAYQDGYDTALKNKNEYDELINGYRDTIITLNDNISQLNSQNRDCQNLIDRLQESGLQDEQTIASLRAIISGNNDQIASLREEIKALNKSISYYQQLVANLDLDEQVVVTFEYDGSVCNFQILDRNSLVTISEPQSTENAIFNGWTVDGQPVDLTTYRVTKNTRFVADVIHQYSVNFIVDGENISQQTIFQNCLPAIPVAPTKNGYEFNGWTIDGVEIVDAANNPVNKNINYLAVFSKLHTVTFIADGTTLSTQILHTNDYAVAPEVNIEGRVFLNWLVDESEVNVSEYAIVRDTVFVAAMRDYTWRLIQTTGYEASSFNSYGDSIWTDGEHLYHGSNYELNLETGTWEVKSWSGTSPYAPCLWTDGIDMFYSRETSKGASYQYRLDKTTMTWIQVSWNGYTPESGRYIWHDNHNTAYYSNSGKQYVLDKATMTWSPKTWLGYKPITAADVWTDGERFYYSSPSVDYILDEATSTWQEITFNNKDRLFQGESVWHIGDKVYFSWSVAGGGTYQYELNKTTMTWEEKTWNVSRLDASQMFVVNGKLYYVAGKTGIYVFD